MLEFVCPTKPAALETETKNWHVDEVVRHHLVPHHTTRRRRWRHPRNCPRRAPSPPLLRARAQVDIDQIDAAGLLGDLAERVDDNALALADQASFDLLYSAVKALPTLRPAVCQRTCEVASAALRSAARACKRALAASVCDAELAELRTVLKMAAFFQTWLVQEAEKMEANKASLSAAAPKAAAAGKKGGKKAAAADEEAWSWEPSREDAVLRLLEALELDLRALWGHRTPDESFLLYFSRAAYTILEQPAALKSGAASLRDCLWRLIALPAVKFEQAEATVSGACAGCVCGRHLPHGQHSRRGSARWSRRLGEVGSGRRALLAGLVKLLLGAEHAAAHLAELMQRLLEEHEAVRLEITASICISARWA